MFVVILLPEFRLQAALRHKPELRGKAIAVVEKENAKGLVSDRTEAAEKFGVSAGMAAVQALARCPHLLILPRAHEQEKSVRAALLEAACSLSPDVEVTADGYCTVDMRRGGIRDWSGFGAEIVRRISALELSAQIGIAPNPDLAFLAARKAARVLVVQTPEVFLSHLAVAEIDPPPHLLSVLREWGIHTLGQLTSLPRGELANRLGPEADWLWQRAAGSTQRLLRIVRPAEEFSESFDFEREIETLEPLLFILRRFLDQLLLRLSGVNRVAGKMVLILPLENDGEYVREFSIPSPTGDAAVLFRILDTHLESLKLERRPTGCRLEIEAVNRGHQQMRFFENPLKDANRFGETLARLTALVGEGNVGVVEMENTHRPDCFRLVAPRFHELGEAISEGDELAVGVPLRRYRPAMPAHVRVLRHAPAFVVSDTAHGMVTSAHGPYRRSGGWWDRELWGCEEWDVEIAENGIYRLGLKNGQWFVEGCYETAIH
jgi:protein ImuB